MGKSEPECVNSSNPAHECNDYCLHKIAEAKRRLLEELPDSWKRAPEDRTVHPDCINASNPYHDCSEYCFKKIADAKAAAERGEPEKPAGGSVKSEVAPEQADGDDDSGRQEDAGATDDGYPQMTEKQKLFELQLKMNEARKANQQAMVAEKKRMEPRGESRGVSKEKWLEDRKKKIGRLLDSNGLDMSKSYMLDTQDMAEAKYKKWEKEPAPHIWDVFNQKTLYDAYKKRTKNIEVEMEAYNRAKKPILNSTVRLQVFNMGRCLGWRNRTSTEWLMSSRSGMRSGKRSAGGANSTKTRTLTRSTTGTSTSTRRSRGPLANTRSRSRTTWKEGPPCQIIVLAFGIVHSTGAAVSPLVSLLVTSVVRISFLKCKKVTLGCNVM